MKKEIKFNKYQQRSTSYHWQQISRSIFNFNAFVQARYQQVVDLIPKTKNQKILDIGCGDGVLLSLIYQKTNSKITGIDSDKDSLKSAKLIFRQMKISAKFIRASAYQLPFKVNQFDIVIAAEIIEHLNNPNKLLSEMARVIKPDGKAIITTPIKLTTVPEDKMHVQEFTKNDFKNLLNQYFKKVIITASHPACLTKLYTLTLFKIAKFHFDPFRWIINIFVLLTGLNPFKIKLGKPSQQIAICQNKK